MIIAMFGMLRYISMVRFPALVTNLQDVDQYPNPVPDPYRVRYRIPRVGVSQHIKIIELGTPKTKKSDMGAMKHTSIYEGRM